MLTEERRNLIVSYVNDKNAVTVAELMEEFNASAATIRCMPSRNASWN